MLVTTNPLGHSSINIFKLPDLHIHEMFVIKKIEIHIIS